jgi:hypothetical protein
MENGNRVIFTSNNASVQLNLTKLSAEVTNLRAAFPGITVDVDSAYRPLSYQQHLYELWYKWNSEGLKISSNPDCDALKSKVAADGGQHGVLNTLVSSPSTCAPHVRGVGIDLRISGAGLPLNNRSTVNTLLHQKGVGLYWQGIPDDPWHFNLANAPYNGCVSQ